MSSISNRVVEGQPGSPEVKDTAARIGQINGRLRKTAADLIEIGLLLRDLHQSLPQGWKARIYSDSDDPLPGIEPLDITQADGEQLIRIARNDALSNSRNPENLPCARSTLDVLSSVPAETLQAAIDRGDVNPKLKEHEAKQLARNLKGEPATARRTEQSPHWNAETQKKWLDDRIFAAVKAWIAACPLDQVSYPVARLREIADYLQDRRQDHAMLTLTKVGGAGIDFLSTEKVKAEALARKEAAEKGGPSLTKPAITDYVNKLVGRPYGPVKAVDVVQVIERVIEGRICGDVLELPLLAGAIKAQIKNLAAGP